MAITGTFALAAALAARSGLAHAAAHQICLQLWLASSLLADSLAVAAQTLLAQGLAARALVRVRQVGMGGPLAPVTLPPRLSLRSMLHQGGWHLPSGIIKQP